MVYTTPMSNLPLSSLIATKKLKTLTFKFREDGYTTDRTTNVLDASLMHEGSTVIVMLSLEAVGEQITFYDDEARIVSQPQDRSAWVSIPAFADEVLITW